MREAREAFNSVYAGNIEVTRISVVQGTYAFHELLAWYKSLTYAMATDEIDMSSGAVMETKNRIAIGIPNLDRLPNIHNLMEKLSIPVDAVTFHEEQVNLLGGKDSTRAK